MSFRKRNVVVSQPGSQPTSVTASHVKQTSPGTRPSPLDGRLTISTGTKSLDSLLAGHAGLVLGSSILIEESGTTDFGGTLLKYYAAEGVTQGHHVHVLGVSEGWGRELPGLSSVEGGGKEKEEPKSVDEKMKIAWRYERLGEFGGGSRGERSPCICSFNKGALTDTLSEQTEMCPKQATRPLELPRSSVMTLISVNVLFCLLHRTFILFQVRVSRISILQIQIARTIPLRPF